MRAVVQRVSQASVRSQGEAIASVGVGLLVLLGIAVSDSARDAQWLADKVAGLRIFSDEGGKMSRAAADVGGEFLVVSQFTLYGSIARGRRPDFTRAAPGSQAKTLYQLFCDSLAALGHPPKTGIFGVHMEVRLVNDGPVTIYIDTDEVMPHGL